MTWVNSLDRLQANYEPYCETVDLTDGESRLSYFGSDDTPRTQAHFLVLGGRRPRQSVQGYPTLDQPLPTRMSLEDICHRYPNHVSGTMLLIFAAAGWSAAKIWDNLPMAFRKRDPLSRANTSKATRPAQQYQHLVKMTNAQKDLQVKADPDAMSRHQQGLLSSGS